MWWDGAVHRLGPTSLAPWLCRRRRRWRHSRRAAEVGARLWADWRAGGRAPQKKRRRSHCLDRDGGGCAGTAIRRSFPAAAAVVFSEKRSTVRPGGASRRLQRNASARTRFATRPRGGVAQQEGICVVRLPRDVRVVGGDVGGGGFCRGREILGCRRGNARKVAQRCAATPALRALGPEGQHGDVPSAWQGARLAGPARTGDLAWCCIQRRKAA